MEFTKFCRAGMDIIQREDVKKSTVIAEVVKKQGRNASWNTIRILVLKYCFHRLFVQPQTISSCINDLLLDFDTVVKECNPRDVVMVRSPQGDFCFTTEELLSIFHSDLSRSTLDIDPQYGIASITKNFRLPTNPYTQRVFTEDEIAQIVDQVALKAERLPREHFEAYMFFQDYRALLRECSGKSNYEVVGILEAYFESRGVRYVQQHKKKENTSRWSAVVPKDIRTDAMMYAWFLDHVFWRTL